MRRLIFTNKVGNNENHYIVGSGVGSQNRFTKSALKRRASNSSGGTCCIYNDNTTIINGSLIDGYIKNASGKIIDILTNKTIKTITTDDLGNFILNISKSIYHLCLKLNLQVARI